MLELSQRDSARNFRIAWASPNASWNREAGQTRENKHLRSHSPKLRTISPHPAADLPQTMKRNGRAFALPLTAEYVT